MKKWTRIILLVLGFFLLLLLIFKQKLPARYNFIQKHPSLFISQIKHFLFEASPTIPQIEIEINKQQQKALSYQRKLANIYGVKHKLLTNGFEYEKCKIIINDTNINAKLKLKGCYSGHWGPGVSKVSYKFKSKTPILDCNAFGIQAPVNRGYLNDWLLHQLAGKLDILHPFSQFVKVNIWDKTDTYLFEEYPDENTLLRQKRPNGPIAEFDADVFWKFDMHYRDSVNNYRVKLNYESINDSLNKLLITHLEDTNIFAFDYHAWATYFSLLSLCGNHFHATAIQNLQFYLNPNTLLIEPILFDQNHIEPHYDNIGLSYLIKKAGSKSHITERLMQHKDFQKYFLTELNRLINDLPDLLHSIKPIYEEAYLINVKQDPLIDYHLGIRTLQENASKIKQLFSGEIK